MTSKYEILRLYKTLLRESQKFPEYNFRKYAIRRVHDRFKENKNVSDPDVISVIVTEAQKNLEIIKRQALIGQMYRVEKLVIENVPK